MPKPVRFMPQMNTIAGISIGEIARQFGTPTFAYDEAMIRSRLADLQDFDVVRYAQKACSNLAILEILRQNGAKVDAVSATEVRRGLAAGFSAGDEAGIVYTADIFDRDALELCVREGIHVNCGSLEMIRQWSVEVARQGRTDLPRELTLRINPGFGHGHSQKTNTGGPLSKHGIWWEELPEAMEVAKNEGVTITGLHIHIGSGTDLEHLSQCCEAMKTLALQVGKSVRTISSGGGLPTVYREGDTYVDLKKYYGLWDAVRKDLEKTFGHAVTLEIEPGRYLVAESGYLVTEIRAVKRQGENTFYLVDAGFNNLARPVLYGSYHPMFVCPADGNVLENAELRDVIVGGPLCESGDIFTQEEGGFVQSRKLPEAKVGDYLVIGCAGAYGFVMGSNYNSKPYAAEVLLRRGEMLEIRRRQTFAQLIENERVPEVLLEKRERE
ncbi:MAG: diaminopimelate decarboxylase [Planctomycetia bacterium]|nr:diaminopimelate decarboxylase [Planctomycetia bacterium]